MKHFFSVLESTEGDAARGRSGGCAALTLYETALTFSVGAPPGSISEVRLLTGTGSGETASRQLHPGADGAPSEGLQVHGVVLLEREAGRRILEEVRRGAVRLRVRTAEGILEGRVREVPVARSADGGPGPTGG